MISRTDVSEEARIGPGRGPDRPGLVWLLLLSAWCGLVAGLLEVGTIVLRKQAFDPNHLYGMSRHFVWLIPLTNLCVFLALGLLGCGVVLVWPRRGRWLFTRGLCALTLLPAAPGRLSPDLRSGLVGRGAGARRAARPGARAACRGLPAVRPGQLPGGRRRSWRSWGRRSGSATGSSNAREDARPLPPPGSPNVLLIVMDTVAAGHLSLHGYDRPTSPTLVELAERGIRFDSARAASSWTLPSHATMFTGRWLHELSVGWLTPLDRDTSHAGGVPRGPGLRDGRLRRQYVVLCHRFGAGPRLHALPRISSSPSSPRSRRPCWSIGPWRASRRSSISRGLAGVRRAAARCRAPLAVAGHRSQGGGGGQSRAPRLARRGAAAGAAVLRLLELLRCPLSLSSCRRGGSTASGSSRRTTISAS